MLYDSILWIDDINRVIATIPELKELEGNTVFITGASGLIGSAVIDLLLRYNELHDSSIKIFVAGRSYSKMHSRFGERMENMTFVEYDASKHNDFYFKADYIIHAASNASPDTYTKEPVETMSSNFLGMKELLDYANNVKSKRILYVSSSEVYGKKDTEGAFLENQYGYVDVLNSRSSYPIGKRAAETLCISYSDEFRGGVEVVIVRPGHIYGPTALRGDKRIASAWAFDVACGRDIVMKSDGKQIRSYCYCLDCASAIIKVLMCGEKNNAYNISNPDSVISIAELAEILTDVGKCKLIRSAPSDEEKKSFNPMNNSSLNSEKLLSLGWHGLFNARTGIEHTVRIIRDSEDIR